MFVPVPDAKDILPFNNLKNCPSVPAVFGRLYASLILITPLASPLYVPKLSTPLAEDISASSKTKSPPNIRPVALLKILSVPPSSNKNVPSSKPLSDALPSSNSNPQS